MDQTQSLQNTAQDRDCLSELASHRWSTPILTLPEMLGLVIECYPIAIQVAW